jgi:hypothetical protein
VCGSVNQTSEDIEVGSRYISSPIFSEYAQEIHFNNILDSNVGQVNTYELALKAQKLFLEVGNKIISDTNGIENNDLLNLTSIELPYLTETTVIAGQHIIPNTKLKNNSVYTINVKDDKNKINVKDQQTIPNTKLNREQMEYPLISQGGNKNTKNNKKYVKNKLTKGKAIKYKNKTKKHRTIKHKLNKKLNKRSKRKI